MLQEREIQFKFKGNRDYVHGTDIFDNVLESARIFFDDYPTRIQGSFHRLLTNNGILRIYNHSEVIDYQPVYALFYVQEQSSSFLMTVSNADSIITSSYEYDEQKVLHNVRIEDNKARMFTKSSYTYIEQIVAMTKKLHLTLYPDAKKNWLFTKIQIKEVLHPSLYTNHELAIKAVKNFHYKLTQNAIFLDDNLVGNIWFSQAS